MSLNDIDKDEVIFDYMERIRNFCLFDAMTSVKDIPVLSQEVSEHIPHEGTASTIGALLGAVQELGRRVVRNYARMEDIDLSFKNLALSVKESYEKAQTAWSRRFEDLHRQRQEDMDFFIKALDEKKDVLKAFVKALDIFKDFQKRQNVFFDKQDSLLEKRSRQIERSASKKRQDLPPEEIEPSLLSTGSVDSPVDNIQKKEKLSSLSACDQKEGTAGSTGEVAPENTPA